MASSFTLNSGIQQSALGDFSRWYEGVPKWRWGPLQGHETAQQRLFPVLASARTLRWRKGFRVLEGLPDTDFKGTPSPSPR